MWRNEKQERGRRSKMEQMSNVYTKRQQNQNKPKIKAKTWVLEQWWDKRVEEGRSCRWIGREIRIAARSLSARTESDSEQRKRVKEHGAWEVLINWIVRQISRALYMKRVFKLQKNVALDNTPRIRTWENSHRCERRYAWEWGATYAFTNMRQCPKRCRKFESKGTPRRWKRENRSSFKEEWEKKQRELHGDKRVHTKRH